MRLVTRYVLREILQVFLVTLIALTGLMVMFGAVREAIAQGLGPAQIVVVIPFLLPTALMFAIPGSILFAVSSVYGRMSGSNEVIALKAMGLSPMAILWPTLMLAGVLSLLTVWLNDVGMSWGHAGVQRVAFDSLDEIAYGVLRSQKSFSAAAFSVTVKGVEGRTLIAPNFSTPAGSDQGPVNFWAETAELHSKPGSGELVIELYNGTVDSPEFHGTIPGRFERVIRVNPEAGKNNTSPAHMALREIPEAIVRQRELIQEHEQRMIAQTSFHMLTGEFDGVVGDGWKQDASRLQNLKFQIYRMQTEPPRRWANGFSCLCFALVGSAMAIRLKSTDVLTSFGLCFVPILLTYYPFLLFGVDRAKAGAITPYAVWLANAFLAVWGLWLLRRVLRY